MKQVYEGVKLSLVDRIPKFHHFEASCIDYNRSASSIFVVNHSTLNSMDPKIIQQVFSKRHILVTDVPFDDEYFDARSLSKVGSLSRVLDMQGETMPSVSLVYSPNMTLQWVHSGTLMILEACTNGGHWVTWLFEPTMTILMS